MPITRTLYAGQEVKITCGNGTYNAFLPVQSASCEVTKPIETVNAFGHINSLASLQTNVTSCKSSVKAYLTNGAAWATGAGGFVSGVSKNLLNFLVGDAISGNNTVIQVAPNGFKMSGTLTSMGIDISAGALGTIDFAFNGLGQPLFSGITTAAVADQGAMPVAITPVNAVNVADAISGSGCATSFKFSYDLPTENLVCLGDPLDGLQGTLNSTMATKPPYKTSISVEGYGVSIVDTGIPPANTKYTVGGLSIQLPNGIVTSKSFNNAVGNANATFNYTIEDTTAVFS